MVFRGIWSAIEPGYVTAAGVDRAMTAAEEEANLKALSFLVMVVGDEYLQMISDSPRAREAWKALEERHTKFSCMHTVQLVVEYVSLRKTDDMSVAKFLASKDQLYQQIKAGGLEFSDCQRACFILTGLIGTDYDNMVRNIETAEADAAQLTTEKVKTKLILEELRMSREDSVDAKAFAAKGKQKNFFKSKDQKSEPKNPDSEVRRPGKNVVCFGCGKIGHISRNCPHFNREKKKEKEEEVVVKSKALKVVYGSCKKSALCSKTKTLRKRGRFYLDSGATHHMSPHRELFFDLEPCGGSVAQADDTQLAVKGIGQVRLTVSTSEGDCVLKFSDVLYVPEMADTLISGRQLDKKGIKMVIFNGVCSGYDGKTNDLLFEAQADDNENMYVLEGEVDISGAALKATATWHDRFGHQCKLPDVKGVSDKKDEKCEVCVLGKFRRSPFPTSHNRASKKLEMIHSDVDASLGVVPIIQDDGEQQDNILEEPHEEQPEQEVEEKEVTPPVTPPQPQPKRSSSRVERRSDEDLTLDQETYLTELLEEFGMSESKSLASPLQPQGQHDEGAPAFDARTYRRATGSLLHLANNTRPDVSHATSRLCSSNQNPSIADWTNVKHVMRYLKGTKEVKLRYSKQGKPLEIFVDSDWAGDCRDRKSFSGLV
ncbi:hypothetical protein FOCC_FOCC017854, partial [Frankliniella occidentalis]